MATEQAIVSAQVDAAEKRQLERLAADADRTLSAEIRRLIRRHLAATRPQKETQ
jgi:ferritin-like metal-binding protein YciE